MAFRFILLIMPALVLAIIDVELSGKYNGDEKYLKVYFNGRDISIISDAERNIFNVNDNNLKDVAAQCIGKRPDDVFVHNPTPWGDLYSKYGWDEVTRTLMPKSATILRVASQPTIVVNQTFENYSTKQPANYNVGITQSVSNTVSSSWSTGKEFTIGQKFNYGINILYKIHGETYSNLLNATWGMNTQQSQTVTVGASSDLDVTLQPGEAVLARLEATRGFVQVEMEYEASLSGHFIANYAYKYDGHHFHGHSIAECMSKAGLNNHITSKEIIDIGFYTDSKIVVSDINRDDVLKKVSF